MEVEIASEAAKKQKNQKMAPHARTREFEQDLGRNMLYPATGKFTVCGVPHSTVPHESFPPAQDATLDFVREGGVKALSGRT